MHGARGECNWSHRVLGSRPKLDNIPVLKEDEVDQIMEEYYQVEESKSPVHSCTVTLVDELQYDRPSGEDDDDDVSMTSSDPGNDPAIELSSVSRESLKTHKIFSTNKIGQAEDSSSSHGANEPPQPPPNVPMCEKNDVKESAKVAKDFTTQNHAVVAASKVIAVNASSTQKVPTVNKFSFEKQEALL